MNIEQSLSYDDVLLLPRYSDFTPDQADVATTVVGDVRLNMPILSAAMDTVTEADLAIALALQGGAGVVHSNMSPEDQAAHVKMVKRFLNWVIEGPVVVEEGESVAQAAAAMQDYGVSGLPVVAGEKLVGILTSRDMRFCRDMTLKVRDVMTPNPVVEIGNPHIDSAKEKFDSHKIEKLPVVDDGGRLTGLITVKDLEKHEQFPRAATDPAGRLLVGAALPPSELEERMPLLQDAKVDFVVVDTAHGHSRNVLAAVEQIRSRFPTPVVGGNVATQEGTRRLIDAGAQAVKVGVGPGSICTTRVVAGVGVPQLSAVMWATEVAREAGIPVIADGGIKYSGDIVKALAAGASTVMIGSLFAGLREAPGQEIIYEGRIFKTYRGMGSIGAMKRGSGKRYQASEEEEMVPEGVEGRVPYRGELAPYVHQLVTGLRKGMGYCGARTLADLRERAQFVQVSPAGLRESHVHDVSIMQEPPNYSR
jgi:IMP dehydrogenase